MTGLELRPFNYPLHNVYLVGEVNEEMYVNLTKKIDEIREDDENVIINNFSVLQSIGINISITPPEINIYINTYGGCIYDMFSIYDMLKGLQKNYVVNIYCQGKVMSAGTVIMLAVEKKHRFAYSNCTFMFHDIASGKYGKLKDIEEDVDEGKRLHKMMFQIFKDNTKLPEKILKDMYESKKDVFLSPKEAKRYCIIDEIIQ